jgi:hypothetical protein
MADADLDAILGDDDDDDEDTPTAAQQDSSVLNEARKRERALKRELKAAQAELETVKPYREKYLSTQVPQMFEEQGFPKNLTKLYLSSIGDAEPTADSIKTWAAENEIVPTTPAEPAPTQGAEATFTPTVGGEPPGQARWDRPTIDAALKEGGSRAAEAVRAINEGRVQWNNPEQVAESMRK